MSNRSILSDIRDLRDRKVRYEQQAFVIEGKKGVEEASFSGITFREVYVTEAFLHHERSWLEKLKVEDYETVSEELLQKVSSTSTAPGILVVAEMPKPVTEVKSKLVVCLAGINDPGNLGTIIRTAEWFGITELILGPGTVDPYNEKVVRSAMGSLFRTHCVPSENLVTTLQGLQAKGYQLVIADMEADSQKVLRKDAPICLIMGSESHGIPDEIRAIADAVYSIPGKSQTESLNVAVSFGIIAHQLTFA